LKLIKSDSVSMVKCTVSLNQNIRGFDSIKLLNYFEK
jgi:hypothetical protein